MGLELRRYRLKETRAQDPEPRREQNLPAEILRVAAPKPTNFKDRIVENECQTTRVSLLSAEPLSSSHPIQTAFQRIEAGVFPVGLSEKCGPGEEDIGNQSAPPHFPPFLHVATSLFLQAASTTGRRQVGSDVVYFLALRTETPKLENA
ncbi:hypothetical protein C8R44DRAFT_736325 [Mycena epipterygia]|nr:hypothetical protein C8R44DRAFT_736325 [Mycena epipterygia]